MYCAPQSKFYLDLSEDSEMFNPDLSVEAMCALWDYVKFNLLIDTLLHSFTCG